MAAPIFDAHYGAPARRPARRSREGPRSVLSPVVVPHPYNTARVPSGSGAAPTTRGRAAARVVFGPLCAPPRGRIPILPFGCRNVPVSGTGGTGPVPATIGVLSRVSAQVGERNTVVLARGAAGWQTPKSAPYGNIMEGTGPRWYLVGKVQDQSYL